MTARFLEFRFLVGAVGTFLGGLLSRLGNVGRAFGEIFAVFLLFVNDFFIVRYVAGVGHPLP